MDRSIVFELRRKLPIEKVEHLRHANDGLFDALAQKLARFADDYRGDVRRARPALPDALNDRAQDNWEPLLAIAGTAGGPWPGIARQAALRLSKSDNAALSTGVELLSDIREIFRTRNVIRISTDELIKALCADHEKQWATCNRGKEINARWLSQKLSGYGIKSGSVRTGAKETPKGYKLESFQEAFASYLPEYPAESATTPQSSIGAALRVADAPMHELHEIPSATPQTLAA
jgi:putative DNA primase/helicase